MLLKVLKAAKIGVSSSVRISPTKIYLLMIFVLEDGLYHFAYAFIDVHIVAAQTAALRAGVPEKGLLSLKRSGRGLMNFRLTLGIGGGKVLILREARHVNVKHASQPPRCGAQVQPGRLHVCLLGRLGRPPLGLVSAPATPNEAGVHVRDGRAA